MLEPHSLEDTVMQQRFREIIDQYGITIIVETGVDKGLSTVVLSKMVPTVIGIDNNLQAIATAYGNLDKAGVKNALLVCDSSPLALQKLKPLLPGQTLYFLDAHWQQYWPLLDEIKAISKGQGIIVIHDCKIPGRPELGYDVWGGKELCYEYVKEALNDWSPSHKIEYNKEANCQKPRGCMYVFPK